MWKSEPLTAFSAFFILKKKNIKFFLGKLMGCAQSKIDNEEAVARSKDRRNLMKDAVSARNAFASGHSGYSFALKNVGAALSDFAHGESVDNQQHQVGS